MNRNRMLAGLLSGLLAVIMMGQAQAKPPDLPLDLKVECRDAGSAAPAAALSGAEEESSLGEEECCPCLDTCCAGVCHWLCQALENACCQIGSRTDAEQLDVMPGEVHRAGRSRHIPCAVKPPGSDGCRLDMDRQDLARQLYRIAECCRKRGDHAMARSCYDEVQRMAPNMPLAYRARQRLELCKQGLGGEEEAEAGSDRSITPDTGSEVRSSWPGPIEIKLILPGGSDTTRSRITIEIRPRSHHTPRADKHP